MCKTRRAFSNSGDVSDENVLVNLENSDSYILRFRSELVNDRNDRT
jgi:hypothetical protein